MAQASISNTINSNVIKKWPRSRKLVYGLVALGAAAACGTGFYFFSQHGSTDWKKNTAKVEKGSVSIEIVATGTIRPVNEIKVSPKMVGLIKKLFVKQGDEVKEGQTIAQMDDSDLKGQIEASRANYEMAQDTYAKLQHGNRPQEVEISKFQEHRARDIVRQAEQNVIRLRAQMTSSEQQSVRDDTIAARQNYLETEGATSDQDRLNAETQAKMTQAQWEAAKRELAQAEATLAQNKSELSAAQQQYELSKLGNRQEDILVAKHAMLQAKGNLDSLMSQLNDMTIVAPFAGVITQKYADAGAIVTPTTSASAPSNTSSATSSSIVALAGQLEMVAQVAETDIGKIEVGQDVDIISNAYPDRSFHGSVTQIAPEAVVNQNVTTFEVHTDIKDDRKGRLLSGMNVSAHFSCGSLDDALLVPTVCIISRHGHSGVLIPDKDGAPTFKRVRVGPTSGTKTVINKGLNEGDLVFLGLNKDQLDKQGYGDSSGGQGQRGDGWGGGRGGRGGGRGGGGGPTTSAPIPRNLGH